jgi:hypothetical protein
VLKCGGIVEIRDLSPYACPSMPRWWWDAELQKAQEMNVEADSIVSIICQPVSSSAEKRRKFTRDIYFQQRYYSLMWEGL